MEALRTAFHWAQADADTRTSPLSRPSSRPPLSLGFGLLGRSVHAQFRGEGLVQGSFACCFVITFSIIGDSVKITGNTIMVSVMLPIL